MVSQGSGAGIRYEWAQFDIGLLYAIGDGEITQDYDEAIGWILKAAEQGLAEAQYNMGIFYANGFAVTQNDTTACQWFNQGIENGFTPYQTSQEWIDNHCY